MVTPDVNLPDTIPAEPLAARVQTVVTLATPHYGTPVAGVLHQPAGRAAAGGVVAGHQLRAAHRPAARWTCWPSWARSSCGPRPRAGRAASATGSGRLHDRILGDFGPDRRGALQSFAELIARDQDLLPQITPAAIDVFNAATQDRPGVRYGCVVTQARGAGLRSFLSAGLSPYAHASHALYVCIGQLAARVPADRTPAAVDGPAGGAEVGVRRRTRAGARTTASSPRSARSGAR